MKADPSYQDIAKECHKEATRNRDIQSMMRGMEKQNIAILWFDKSILKRKTLPCIRNTM